MARPDLPAGTCCLPKIDERYGIMVYARNVKTTLLETAIACSLDAAIIAAVVTRMSAWMVGANGVGIAGLVRARQHRMVGRFLPYCKANSHDKGYNV